MTTDTKTLEPPKNNGWYTYIVECADETYYTGVTTDLKRRVHEHNGSTKGAKYTRCRRPVRLIYFEQLDSRQDACKREYAIKQMKTVQKRSLVQLFNPDDQLS